MILSKEELLKESLRSRLLTGEVEFSYFKKDGTVRTASGTLNSSVILKWGGNLPKNELHVSDHLFTYFDLNSDGWRSFDINKLIEVESESNMHGI